MYQLRKAPSLPGLLVFVAGLSILCLTTGTCCGAESPSVGNEDFGRYIVDHQADLAPFFVRDSNEFLAQAAPLLLQWVGRVLFVALALGWGVDVLLARGFANLFAPSRDKLNSSFFYATGRLTINVFLLIGLESLLIASIRNEQFQTIAISLIALFGLISAGFQIGWIRNFYRTKTAIATLFYLTLIVVHGFLTLGIAALFSRLPASEAAVALVNQSVAPRVEAEAHRLEKELQAIAPTRDQVAKEATQLHDQIEQAQAGELELRKQIEAAKVSESYLYSQAVKIHARGDLAAAHDRLAALLTRFPDGPMTGLVQGQLTQVTNEMAAQDVQIREEAASKIHEAAQAKAELLARAGRGLATLSELRRALLGKTPGEVGALFGTPSETASNVWGFNRQMVLNPLTNERSGLAVYFAEGTVQSVDYYYGNGGPQ